MPNTTGNSIVAALKRLVEPQATLTLGGPGVGVRLRGTPIVADIDPTGPGIGLAPKTETIGNLVDKIPGKRMDRLADRIRRMPGRIFLGAEMQTVIPTPTIGLSVGLDDKDKLKAEFNKLMAKKKGKKKDIMHKKAERKDFKVTVEGSSYDNTIPELLAYIASIGNIGHSFSIVVDPDSKDYTRKFGWDGDGSDYIDAVKLNGKKFTPKKEKKAAYALGVRAASVVGESI